LPTSATGTVAEVGNITDQTRALASLMGADATPVDWVAGARLDGSAVKVPADWCLRRKAPGALSHSDPMSTGTAAGASVADATTHGLLELIERDAAALWWGGGRPARLLDISGARFAETRARLQMLRRGETTRTLRFLDLTSDVGIPVVAVASTDQEGRGLCIGLACRMTMAAAASAALMEAAQMEVGLLFATAKQAELGDAVLSDHDRSLLARAAQAMIDQAPVYSAPTRDDPHTTLHQALQARAIEAVQCNMTRDAGVAVVKMLAPALQLYPSTFIRPRLAATRTAYAGGAAWTQSLPLF
jgi:ribosomal protein S12 methylthiotransferase accessory factor